MKKIGLLALALVLALGSLGIGYAAWTDQITLTGTVNTGTVDLDIVDYSNTWIWKTSTGDEIVIDHFWDIGGDGRTPVGCTVPANVVDAFPNDGEGDTDPVAYADASAGQADNSISITISNAFPLTALTADFLLHYNGTIPVKVWISELGFTDTDGDDFDVSPYVEINYFESTIAGGKGDPIQIAVGDQWHQCKYILVEITVDLDQIQEAQLQSGTINGLIKVIQWNEYGYGYGYGDLLY